MSETERDFLAEADATLGQLTDGLGPEAAARALAILANRTVARLHALSRAQATARKEQPDWAAWAQLQNASRTLVLQASTCRDLALRLAGRQ
jgi:primosomal protein N''